MVSVDPYCACATSAQVYHTFNDLNLLHQLVTYKRRNEIVANAAIKSFSGEWWYLSESLVGLAFFDPMLSVDTKVAMVAALNKEKHHDPPRHIQLDIDLVSQKQLSVMCQRTPETYSSQWISLKSFCTKPQQLG